MPCSLNSGAVAYGDAAAFSGQGEADLAALLSPRLFFPRLTQSLSGSSVPEDTSSAKATGHFLREITLLNYTGHVLILPLVLKMHESHILCKYI